MMNDLFVRLFGQVEFPTVSSLCTCSLQESRCALKLSSHIGVFDLLHFVLVCEQTKRFVYDYPWVNATERR